MLVLLAMVHQFSSFIFEVTPGFGLQWYGTALFFIFVCSYLLVRWMASRQRNLLPKAQVLDFVLVLLFSSAVGARLGYAVFYEPNLFMMFKAEFPFWGLFALNEGGLSVHGAILGVFLGCILFAARFGIGPSYLFDLASIVGALALLLGRSASFFAGELWGRVAPASFAWSVKYPQEIMQWPTINFEKLAGLSEVAATVGVAREDFLAQIDSYRTGLEAQFTLLQTLQKIVKAALSGQGQVLSQVEPLLTARYPSQLIQAGLEGLLLFLILFFFWRRPRVSGVVASLFLILYSVFRFIGEFFREPDVHLGFQWLDLTQGQWLSLVTFFLGLLFYFMWTRRNTVEVLGWGKTQSVRIHRR
jgi:phosphatidylglycerol:prolipoprotein diacylglycerol transferase